MNLWDFLNSINAVNKKSLMEGTENDAITEKIYVPWHINKQLSYFVDTIMYVQDMNINSKLDNKMQYDYLRLSIRPMKRWHKKDKKDDVYGLDLIKKHYKFNNQKAEMALRILSSDELKQLEKMYQVE